MTGPFSSPPQSFWSLPQRSFSSPSFVTFTEITSMFNALQRDRLQDALLNRAEDTNTPRAKARVLRRAANDRRIFDRLIEKKELELRKANPGSPDGTILKMLLDWISNGGLEQILSLVSKIISLFA